MDAPFVYNKYATGSRFVGRREDCSILGNLLAQGENVAIWEPVGTGKKSLVQQTLTKAKLRGEDFLVGNVNVMDIRSNEAFALRLGDTVLGMCASTPDEYETMVRTFLGGTHFVFDRNVFSRTDSILSLNWEMDDNDLAAVLSLPYRVSVSRGIRMHVIVDEFQNLDLTEDSEKLFKAMEEAMDGAKATSASFSYVFMGSMVNAMDSIFRKRHFFYRRHSRLSLSTVDEKEISEYVIKGFLSSGKVVDRDLVAGTCRLFRCNLFYINFFFSICDAMSKGYIMEPVLLGALDSVIAVNTGRFVSMVTDLTTFQVSLLKAIIDGHTKFSASEVIKRYSLNSSANVRRLKDALMKKEIITFEGMEEKPVILDPLFEYWLRNYYFKTL